MYKTLAPDCIGHRGELEESAPLAEKYGFDGIWFNICLLYTSPSPRDRG